MSTELVVASSRLAGGTPEIFAAFRPIVEQHLKRAVLVRAATLDGQAAEGSLAEVFGTLFRGYPDGPLRSRFYIYAAPIMRRVILQLASQGAVRLPVDCRVERLREWIARVGLLGAQPRLALELHYFCGLSVKRTAAMLGVSTRLVVRDLRYALFLLHNSEAIPRRI